MKSILLSIALLLACATAQATTIHLGTDTACDSAYICTNVPNDADAHHWRSREANQSR
jgi:hypothetical protein